MYHHIGAWHLTQIYIPSKVQWSHQGARFALVQKSGYPLATDLQLELETSHAKELALHFRIPAWAEGATLAINGKAWSGVVVPGRFATVRRTWRSGDRVELVLPMKARLEPLDADHPSIVALLLGPLVLFGIEARDKPITRAELLAAKPANAATWRTDAASGPITFRPFFAIADEPYATYFNV